MTPRLTAPAALLAALPLTLAACAPADPAARAAAEAERVPAVTVVGPAENCIERSQMRASIVRSDSVIDFEMVGGKVYRNTLRQRCPALGFERAITYETAINQLCTPQIVYALQNIGGVPQRGAACALGEFVPVEYAKGKTGR